MATHARAFALILLSWPWFSSQPACALASLCCPVLFKLKLACTSQHPTIVRYSMNSILQRPTIGVCALLYEFDTAFNGSSVDSATFLIHSLAVPASFAELSRLDLASG